MSRQVLLLSCLLQVGCFSGDYLPPAREYQRLENDLSRIDNAQQVFRNSKGTYGNLADLSSMSGIVGVFDMLKRDGYSVNVESQVDHYKIRIYPKVFSSRTSVLSVYSDESRRWRYGWGKNDVAGPKSRLINMEKIE